MYAYVDNSNLGNSIVSTLRWVFETREQKLENDPVQRGCHAVGAWGGGETGTGVGGTAQGGTSYLWHTDFSAGVQEVLHISTTLGHA